MSVPEPTTTCLTPSKQAVLLNESPTFLSYNLDRIKNKASNNSSLPRKRLYRLLPIKDRGIDRYTRPTILLLLRVFGAAETEGGKHFTEPLSSNKRIHTHTDTQCGGRDLCCKQLRFAQEP
jgi:hypothetical protein